MKALELYLGLFLCLKFDKCVFGLGNGLGFTQHCKVIAELNLSAISACHKETTKDLTHKKASIKPVLF